MTTSILHRGVGLRAGRGSSSGRSALGWLRAALARHEARKALARMDDRLLADVGISREEAIREASKPFWVR